MECSDDRSSLCLAGGQRQASFDADRMAVRHPGAVALRPPPSGAGIRGRSPGHGPPAHPRSLPSPAYEDRKILFGECRGSFACEHFIAADVQGAATVDCPPLSSPPASRSCVQVERLGGQIRPAAGRRAQATLCDSGILAGFIKRPILTEWQRSMQLWPVRRQAVVPLCPAISGPTCRQHVLSSLTSFRYIAHAEAE